MKVLVMGGTGMLGSAVAKYLQNVGMEVAITCRSKSFGVACDMVQFSPILEISIPEARHPVPIMVFDPISMSINEMGIEKFDCIINCIGVIKPFVDKVGKANTTLINSAFPHQLASFCTANDIKLIHITTDCVFSGKEGGYTEDDTHDATDFYGRSKSLGEPVDNAMVLRTSIIGEEIHNNVSLIEWAKSMKGKEVSGYANHWWNGMTTKQYAKICHQIMTTGLWRVGLYHVFSPTPVSKYDLLEMLSSRFDLNLSINHVFTPEAIDRTLLSQFDLNDKLAIPSIGEQILEM